MSSLRFLFLNVIFVLLLSLFKPSVATRFISNHNDNINNTQKLRSIKFPLKRVEYKPAIIGSNGYTTDVEFDFIAGYYTDIFIGTPSRKFSFLIDTGSSLSWVRCFSCNDGSCYRSKQFYPENSKSFSPVACDSDTCQRYGKCDDYNQCGFGLTYSGNTIATGLLATETFTIEDEDTDTQEVPGVPLGCANGSTNSLKNLDGILGLGADTASFTSVLARNYGFDKFSYCLVDQIDDEAESSSMLFGEQVLSRNTEVFYTPQLTEYSEHYAVKLLGVSVADEQMGASSFPITMVIDTGSTTSYLPGNVFTGLRDKYKSVANGLGWVQNTDQGADYTCYNIKNPGQLDSLPPMVFHFDGENANLELKSHNIWQYRNTKKGGVACLGFQDASKINNVYMMGNIQQQNIRVLYDNGDAFRVGFDPSGCL